MTDIAVRWMTAFDAVILSGLLQVIVDGAEVGQLSNPGSFGERALTGADEAERRRAATVVVIEVRAISMSINRL